MYAKIKTVFISCLFLTLVGCTTTYGPAGFTGGYKERKINDDTYIVSFFGNGHTKEQQVWNFWIYRCAELTLKNGYEFFTLKPSDEHAVWPEELHTKPFIFSMLDTGSGKFIETVYNRPVYYITTYSSKAIVKMYKTPVPKKIGILFDAKTIMNQLESYVTSNAKNAPPLRKDILVRAAVEAAIRSNRIRENQRDKLQKRLYNIL